VLKFQELVHIIEVTIHKSSKLEVWNYTGCLKIAIMAFLDLPLIKHIYVSQLLHRHNYIYLIWWKIWLVWQCSLLLWLH